MRYPPHYMGRLDRNASAHPVSMQNIKRVPSEYARCFYYDSCVYAPSVLEALIARVGADRVLFGTDYPFGEQDPRSATSASQNERSLRRRV